MDVPAPMVIGTPMPAQHGQADGPEHFLQRIPKVDLSIDNARTSFETGKMIGGEGYEGDCNKG